MNKSVTSMFWLSGLLVSLLIMQAFASSDAKRGKDEKDALHGIHIRLEGSSPSFNNQAKQSVKLLEAACKNVKLACSSIITDPGASAKAKARCASATGVFHLKGGPLHDVGRRVTDEYFVPTRSWSARVVKLTRLRQTGICEAEIVETEEHEIRHYKAGGYTRYKLHDSTKSGRHWTRSVHGIDPKLASVLAAAFLDPGKISVSPPMGHKTFLTGLKCEVRQVRSAAVTFNQCLHHTGQPFPSHLRFESEVVSDDGKVWLEDRIVAYEHDVTLHYSLFMPPEHDKLSGDGASSSGPANATSAWCLGQKAKTGVNPCDENDDE